MSDTDDLDEIDIRTVAVIWAEDEQPDVQYSGCSIYEAYGLLRRALLELEDEMMSDDEDDD